MSRTAEWEIDNIEPAEVDAGNPLSSDYIRRDPRALSLYSHDPLDFESAYSARVGVPYPRAELAETLLAYNRSLGADAVALANIESIADATTMCVVSGQQAGFLGGPAYTFYKIATSVRLATELQNRFNTPVVPVFWLATEDHDFDEINHAYYETREGALNRVQFDWDKRGNSISDLGIDTHVRAAFEHYLDRMRPGRHFTSIREFYSFDRVDSFATWCARTWSRIFSGRGLIVVEPRTIRSLSPSFFVRALKESEQITRRLGERRTLLRELGYPATLTDEVAGTLYTYEPDGRRVRITDPERYLDVASADAGRLSTDAALRPVFQDTVLPIIAAILGPGEIAYQAMIGPLYDLFEVPQPLLFPRKSYTVAGTELVETAREYGTSVRDLLTGRCGLKQTLRALVPQEHVEAFREAERGIRKALAPLEDSVRRVDPNLGRSWESTESSALHCLARLENRTANASLSRHGMSKRELLRVLGLLKPKHTPQDRVFPLPHFLNDYGAAFVDDFLSIGDLFDFTHNLVTRRP